MDRVKGAAAINFDLIKYSIGSSLLPPHAAPCGIRSFLDEPQRSATSMLAQLKAATQSCIPANCPRGVIRSTTFSLRSQWYHHHRPSFSPPTLHIYPNPELEPRTKSSQGSQVASEPRAQFQHHNHPYKSRLVTPAVLLPRHQNSHSLSRPYSIQSRTMTSSSGTGTTSNANSSPGSDSSRITEANRSAATQQEFNAWQQPGPAAYDFRSDTMTTPTAAMLKAITHTTLLDDVVQEDPTTNSLEADMASLSGHEAGLLVMSGTMGNQVALRTHLAISGGPPHSVLCDIRGHIYNYEAGGVSAISGAQLIAVRPSNGHHLTLEDVQQHTILSDDVHACPTRVISLENTLDGTIMPLEETRRIAEFARQNNIRLHLDGARLWEAVAADAGSLPEYASCFDSVSMCFSKGLAAPIGSVVVGSKSFIAHARRIRKMLGGATRQAGVISAAAKVAVDEAFGKGPRGQGGKLRDSHARARKVANMWRDKGGKLAKPVETNMVWLDLKDVNVSIPRFVEIAAAQGLKTSGGRLVVHYQICDDAIERLGRVMDEVLSTSTTK
ncbi:hypothetical protein HRR80_001283 [Exophiala dermatitidis]|nr:hypothetical protein HRR76_007670 [Exophiala dermatitidis]KAJ4623777.1 hypothetical protein HRR85_000633 [Exophiala dermatitidis]KAJ4630861.1 hypothetical protein HRR86_002402 [Exophiala dermatitidis]KAJ4699078.1 hypothetical protein HRR87_000628 [Exophiala dermatitidis]KAJ8994571.1 hypothetical protein HRR80_001283 [Exophiala dermatitidis]